MGVFSGAQHKTIEGVLERGEKLDSLVDKSAALSASCVLPLLPFRSFRLLKPRSAQIQDVLQNGKVAGPSPSSFARNLADLVRSQNNCCTLM